MPQVLVPRCDTCGKASIQSTGKDGFDLMNRKQMLQLHLDVRLSTPEFAKGVSNQPMPRYRSGNSDSKRTSSAVGNPLGAPLRIFDVLQDASRIAQKQFAGS